MHECIRIVTNWIYKIYMNVCIYICSINTIVWDYENQIAIIKMCTFYNCIDVHKYKYIWNSSVFYTFKYKTLNFVGTYNSITKIILCFCYCYCNYCWWYDFAFAMCLPHITGLCVCVCVYILHMLLVLDTASRIGTIILFACYFRIIWI